MKENKDQGRASFANYIHITQLVCVVEKQKTWSNNNFETDDDKMQCNSINLKKKTLSSGFIIVNTTLTLLRRYYYYN